MVDVGSFHYWGQHPRFQLFPEDTPAPQWCEDSAKFLAWADTLLEKLAREPTPASIAWAKVEVQDRYYWLYKGSELDHKAEYNLDHHPCTHQAYILICDKLWERRLAVRVPELEPPPPPAAKLQEEPEDAEVVEEVINIAGLVMGHKPQD